MFQLVFSSYFKDSLSLPLKSYASLKWTLTMCLLGQQYGSGGKSALLQKFDHLSLIPRRHVRA